MVVGVVQVPTLWRYISYVSCFTKRLIWMMVPGCYCTSTYCICNTQGTWFGFNSNSTAFSSGPPGPGLEYFRREPQPDRIGQMKINATMLKSWRIWNAWKRELPMLWEIALPKLKLTLLPIKVRSRERKHVMGHSPRR